MKTISILNKHVAKSAQFMHLTQWFVGWGSALGNEYSHLANSKAKFKCRDVEEAVIRHREDFIRRLLDYKNPDNREMLVYLRSIYDSYMSGKEIALVCYCRVEVPGMKVTGHSCHSQILQEFLVLLGEHYATNGMTFCVNALAARYFVPARTQQTYKDASVNDRIQSN